MCRQFLNVCGLLELMFVNLINIKRKATKMPKSCEEMIEN